MPSSSTPMFVVGSVRLLQHVRRRAIDVDRVADARREQRRRVGRTGRRVRVRSNDALSPRSASSGRRICSRVRPAASVSSVSGVGPKNPVPDRQPAGPAPDRAERRHARAEERAVFAVNVEPAARRQRQPRRRGRCRPARTRPGTVNVYSNRGTSRGRVGVAFDGDAADPRLPARARRAPRPRRTTVSCRSRSSTSPN